jgi:benzoyl-CoA reductase/2-hydroxyglutaryl-CoA dehydratase subunit BcrC/BadD/HgdB
VACADHPTITASQRSDIFKSAFFMPKEEHTAILNKLLDELFVLPDRTGKKKRVITVGILADAPGLLSIFDTQGFQIVGDDIAAESRAYRVDAIDGTTGLDKMVIKFTNTEDCLLYDPKKQRAYEIVELVKARKAAGVVVLQTKFCDPEEWDYPIIKEALEKAAIPNTIIEVDRQMDNYQQAKTNLEAFSEML